MKKSGYLGLLVLAFLAGLVGGLLKDSVLVHSDKSSRISIGATLNAYDRVMSTGTIRCGYAAWPPLIIKDPNSGQLSGILYDYIEAMGAALNLKIDWSQEVGWGDFPAALESGRIDAFCAGAWPNSSRARQVDFTRPIAYQPMYAYVRKDDPRFDNNLVALNDASITVATMDGEMASLIAAKDFPKAKTLQITQLSSGAESFLNVIDKKADVYFTDPATFAEFDEKNPGKLRKVSAKEPIRVFGDTVALSHGQDEFRRMLDISTDELLSSGAIEKILAKYEKYPGTLLRVAPLYIAQ